MVEDSSLDTSAMSAHLERGWDLLGRGELVGARISATHVLELEPESAEGLTLLGAVTAAEGDPEEALECFRRALDADPDALDAMLYAADLAINPLGRIDLALELCDEAAELVDESDERLELELLRIEAHLAREDLERARGGLLALPEALGDPLRFLRAGRAWLEVDEPARAISLLEEAAKHEATRLDAQYFLGLAVEAEGDLARAIGLFSAVHEGDDPAADLGWVPSSAEVLNALGAVLARVPDPLGSKLRSATFRTAEKPPLELIFEGLDPRCPVLFAGSVIAEGESSDQAATGPRKKRRRSAVQIEPQLFGIFAYQRNLGRLAGNGANLRQELYRALIEEAAFFYALDGAEIERYLEVDLGR